jgi:hypothetical protein
LKKKLINLKEIKKVLSIIVLFIALNSIAQEKAKVQKGNGIEVYLLAEPLREYKTLRAVGKGFNWGSVLTGGFVNASIAAKVGKYIIVIGEEYKG